MVIKLQDVSTSSKNAPEIKTTTKPILNEDRFAQRINELFE